MMIEANIANAANTAANIWQQNGNRMAADNGLASRSVRKLVAPSNRYLQLG